MINKDKALKLALEALEESQTDNDTMEFWDRKTKAITAIKKALAQPAQEPVAWMTPDGEGFRIRFSPPTNDVPLGWDALYTAPPQREWVGLTDEETSGFTSHEMTVVKYVSKVLQEKNT